MGIDYGPKNKTNWLLKVFFAGDNDSSREKHISVIVIGKQYWMALCRRSIVLAAHTVSKSRINIVRIRIDGAIQNHEGVDTFVIQRK